MSQHMPHESILKLFKNLSQGTAGSGDIGAVPAWNERRMESRHQMPEEP